MRDQAYNEAKMRTQQKQPVETFEDPLVVEKHRWNTGAKKKKKKKKKKKHQLNRGEPRNIFFFDPDHLMNIFKSGSSQSLNTDQPTCH